MTNRLKEATAKLETQLIQEALSRLSGNVKRTAADLGISDVALWKKLKKYDIWPDDYRPEKLRWSERSPNGERRFIPGRSAEHGAEIAESIDAFREESAKR